MRPLLVLALQLAGARAGCDIEPDENGHVTIPEGTTAIADHAFRDCLSITSITWPSTLTSIGYGAFRSCTNLELFVGALVRVEPSGARGTNGPYNVCALPDSVTFIGNYAFSYNEAKFPRVVIPRGCTLGGSNTFYAGNGWESTPYSPPSPPPLPPEAPPLSPPEQPPPSPPPPRGLHLSGESAQLKFGLNRECTIEYRPGPPPHLELGCAIQAPPQPPSLPPSPLPPPSPPPPSSPPPQAPPLPQLYMVGGHIARQGQVGDINSYDTVLNQWTKLTAVLPQERSAGTAVRCGASFYVFGGGRADGGRRYYQNLLTNVLKLSAPFDAGSWTVVNEAAPIPVSAPSGAAIGDRIYMMGGMQHFYENGVQTQPAERMKTAYYYDTITDTWGSLPDMPYGAHGTPTLSLNGKLYVLGGAYPTYYTPQAYEPGVDSNWQSLATLPDYVQSFAFCAHNGKIFIMGGFDQNVQSGAYWTYITMVYVYDPASDAWAEGNGTFPANRINPIAASIGGKIIVGGGWWDENRNDWTEITMSDWWSYDPDMGSFTPIASFQIDRLTWAALTYP